MKLALFAPLIATITLAANAASFDCAKAHTPSEKLICSDTSLSDLDAKLGANYKEALAKTVDSEALKVQQRSWVASVRNACKDVPCLNQAYESRIAELADAGSKQVEPAPSVDPAQPEAGATKPTEVAPAPTAASAPAQAAAVASTSGNAEQSATTSSDPGFGVTDVFHVLFALGMIALLAGLLKPSLATFLMKTPTRGKIFACALVYLVPMALASEWSKSSERRAYEASVQAQRVAAKDEERRKQKAAADAAAVRMASAHPARVGNANASAQGIGKDVCTKAGVFALGYMELKSAGRDTTRAVAALDDWVLDYPADTRSGIKQIWLKGFALVDRGQDARIFGSSAEQRDLATDLSVACLAAMKRSGID